jgi:hypothetical protein
MELPIAVFVVGIIVLLAWALPTVMQVVFIGLCFVAAYAVTRAILARRGRR